jgi:hypothetical protein
VWPSCWRQDFYHCKFWFADLFCLGANIFLFDSLHYRTFDLMLAALQTVVTFNVAYRASVVLGAVLLQTSPERGLAGGRMEAFLRAMKDVRHIFLSGPSISGLKTKPYVG